MDMPRRLAVSKGISAPALPAAAAFAAARMSPAKEPLPLLRPAKEPDEEGWCEEDQAVEGRRLTERCRPWLCECELSTDELPRLLAVDAARRSASALWKSSNGSSSSTQSGAAAATAASQPPARSSMATHSSFPPRATGGTQPVVAAAVLFALACSSRARPPAFARHTAALLPSQ